MKVLIISHNPISTQNNMGKTFLSLFSQFERDELCQLYIYPTLPNMDRCASYYRVTDKEALKAITRFQKPGGVIPRDQIREGEGMYEKAEDERLYRNQKNKSALRRMGRDAMWRMAGWYTPALESWLEEQKPQCIFLAPGAAGFIYDFALKIGKKRDIPIVTYICDEYYFVRQPRQLTEKLRLSLFRRKVKALMQRTSHLLTISREACEVYGREFGVKATTLMTGAGRQIAEQPRWTEDPKVICYFGNIRCNRYLSLCDVGRELAAINAERNCNYKLKVYTFEKDEQFLAPLRELSAVELCGAVTGETFDRALQSAPLLLHAEGFDEESIDRVRHSVSTKIADSLASGIPLVAYGPACISSMSHLLRQKCALAATTGEELRPMLEKAFTDEQARHAVVENALKTAAQYHDTQATGRKLREIMEETANR